MQYQQIYPPFSCGSEGGMFQVICAATPTAPGQKVLVSSVSPVHSSTGMLCYLREAFSGTSTNVTYPWIFAKVIRGVCCRVLTVPEWSKQWALRGDPDQGNGCSELWMF